MTKEFQYFSYLKLELHRVLICWLFINFAPTDAGRRGMSLCVCVCVCVCVFSLPKALQLYPNNFPRKLQFYKFKMYLYKL